MTSKEQADAIVNKVVQEFDSTCMGKLPDYRAELYLILKNTIPLTELLEVALAVSKMQDMEMLIFDKTDETTEVLTNIWEKFKALRATGKVNSELLQSLTPTK